jgi:hypothetical protein
MTTVCSLSRRMAAMTWTRPAIIALVSALLIVAISILSQTPVVLK